MSRAAVARLCAGVLLGAGVVAGMARAQTCPPLPGDAFAFLQLSAQAVCPVDPVVRWEDPNHIFDCSHFTTPGLMIDCGGTPDDCVDACRLAALDWNPGLGGLFTYIEGTADFCTVGEPVTPDLGNFDFSTSAGADDVGCDGSAFNQNVLAVAFRRTLTTGELIDSDIVVNQAFDFTPATLRATLGHEFGHVLGLDHPDQCGRNFRVLMRSALDFSDPCFPLTPTADDVAGSVRIYEDGAASPTPTPTATPEPGATCDANGDATIDVIDAANVARAAVGLASSCDANPTPCDANGDTMIDVIDSANVARAAVGLASACPAAATVAADSPGG